MAKKFNAEREEAIVWIHVKVRIYNVRFLLGDLNMSASQICHDLRACGIEAVEIARHVELNEACNEFVHDSCAIIAVGGTTYDPKVNTIEAHCLMAAQVGIGKKGFGCRGYSDESYIRKNDSDRQLTKHAITEELQTKVREFRERAVKRARCNQCTPEQQCEPHEWVFFNGRVAPVRRAAREQGDQTCPVTAHFAVMEDIKAFMSRPSMWDPNNVEMSTCGHWPLYVQIGSTRGRSDEAVERRKKIQFEKQNQKWFAYGGKYSGSWKRSHSNDHHHNRHDRVHSNDHHDNRHDHPSNNDQWQSAPAAQSKAPPRPHIQLKSKAMARPAAASSSNASSSQSAPAAQSKASAPAAQSKAKPTGSRTRTSSAEEQAQKVFELEKFQSDELTRMQKIWQDGNDRKKPENQEHWSTSPRGLARTKKLEEEERSTRLSKNKSRANLTPRSSRSPPSDRCKYHGSDVRRHQI